MLAYCHEQQKCWGRFWSFLKLTYYHPNSDFQLQLLARITQNAINIQIRSTKLQNARAITMSVAKDEPTWSYETFVKPTVYSVV